MSRWEPDIDTTRRPAAERNDPELARAIERIVAGRRAVEERTRGKHWNEISEHDKHILKLNEQRQRTQRNEQREQERRQQGRTPERSGHRRELGRTRYKGLDMTERVHACLQEVGLYRCASHRDLVEAHFSGNSFAAAKGLERLVRSGAMQQHQARGPNGGTFTVYTLTKSGAALAQRLAVKRGLDPEQRAWAGMVKPREAAHDADVAKACRKEIEALTARGGRLRRILIDAELKGVLAKRSETARAKEGKEEADRARQKAAAELHLPCNDQGHVQIPDAQIQYVDESGNIGRVNVEVTSDQYSGASIQAKSGAGFSMHGSGQGGQGGGRTSLSSLGGGGGRRRGGRSSGDPASVEL